MIKKGLNILLVALTGLVLLVHAVVPHHHHHDLEVCVVNINSDSQETSHHHPGCTENHEHNTESKDLSCILEKIVMFRSGQSEQDNKFIADGFDFTGNLFLILTEMDSEDLNQDSYPVDYHFPYIQYSEIIPRCSGLRAPPLA